MKVRLKKIKSSWSDVDFYKKSVHWVGTYLTRTNQRYTGLDAEQRERLEKETGLPLTTREFWENYAIKLDHKGVLLNTEDSFDEVRYLFLKDHKHVKNGYNDPLKPMASYVLINEDLEAQEKNKYNKVKRTAIVEVDSMSLNDMIKCLRIFGVKSDNVSRDVIEAKVNEIAETQPQKFLDLWVNNKNKEIEYIIKEAISKNAIRKNRNVYYYGSDIIGRSIDETVAFMNSKANSDVKMAILNEIEYKK